MSCIFLAAAGESVVLAQSLAERPDAAHAGVLSSAANGIRVEALDGGFDPVLILAAAFYHAREASAISLVPVETPALPAPVYVVVKPAAGTASMPLPPDAAFPPAQEAAAAHTSLSDGTLECGVGQWEIGLRKEAGRVTGLSAECRVEILKQGSETA